MAGSFARWVGTCAISLTLAAPATRADAPIVIRGDGDGRRFDGLGAVSAGGSSRLLFDYPPDVRNEILDYLFKPNYGASMQVLKVEIGGDTNATVGAEAGHERVRGQVQCDRGYEWELMRQARARNPRIVFAALQWGAPGWIEGGFWSQDNVDYVIRWLDCAREQGFDVRYVGGWNERGFRAEWFVKLKETLKKSHPEVKVVAADEHAPGKWWRVATAMANDAAFADAVDVIGTHSPGGWRSQYEEYVGTEEGLAMGKPLWNSEQSALSHDVGGAPWARGINRAYVDARITATLAWPPVSAWYANLPLGDTGLILAEWPWSGHYVVGSAVWAYAHTTQFTQPGWRYIDDACGRHPGGATYVALRSSESDDYTIVIEAIDATAPATLDFEVTNLSAAPLNTWSSNLASADVDDDFVRGERVSPQAGRFAFTVQPGHLYTLSTTTGQSKGSARPRSNVHEQMPLPWSEDFDSYSPGKLARYFSDVNGGFETAPARGGREGMAYQQAVPVAPINWNADGTMPPTTIFGDPRWWGDYELSADVLLEREGYVELLARVAAQRRLPVAGYHLRVGTDGAWSIYSEDLVDFRKEAETIASGEARIEVGRWHRIALRMTGEKLEVVVDGRVVGSVNDARHLTGNAGLRVGDWQHAQFDNVKVTPTAPPPDFVPQAEMKASATSEHPTYHRGDVYPAAFAIDGRPESFWHTNLDNPPALPQSITLNLGTTVQVQGLTYQPRLDAVATGTILKYNVYLSQGEGGDEGTFNQVTSGEWRKSVATKRARWKPQPARFVRLEAVETVGIGVAAGEVNVERTPDAGDRSGG